MKFGTHIFIYAIEVCSHFRSFHSDFCVLKNWICCEKCKQEADLAFDRMLLPLRAQLDEIEDLWRDIHFPPETATITLVYRLLAMKRLDPQVNEYLESLGQGCEVGKIFIEIFVNFH